LVVPSPMAPKSRERKKRRVIQLINPVLRGWVITLRSGHLWE
jgi:hypothetical protein